MGARILHTLAAVVPANAGTHTPAAFVMTKGLCHRANTRDHAVWDPCVRRDDERKNGTLTPC